MPIRVVRKRDLAGTDRHVRNDAYETHRFLLASDGVGVTVTDIVLTPGIEAVYGYDNHVEIAYCVEGEARIVDLGTGEEWTIEPGSLWIAERGDRFRFDRRFRCGRRRGGRLGLRRGRCAHRFGVCEVRLRLRLRLCVRVGALFGSRRRFGLGVGQIGRAHV